MKPNTNLMIKPVLQLGDPKLRQKSSAVTNVCTPEMKRLVRDLSDTFFNAKTKYHYCRGITAPQIGSLKRTILIDDSRFKGPLINPRVISASGPTHEVWDSCLSFNLAFFLQIDRHNSVQIEFFNEEGIKDVLQADGVLSELLQHEIDHLDGILAIDRLKDVRKILMCEEYEKMSRHTRLGTRQSPGKRALYKARALSRQRLIVRRHNVLKVVEMGDCLPSC